MDHAVVEEIAEAMAVLVKGGDTVPRAESRWVRIAKRYGILTIKEVRAARDLYERAAREHYEHALGDSIEGAIRALSEA